LDLVFFGALKRLKPTAVGEVDDHSVNPQIPKLGQAYGQTAISSTMKGSFKKEGMDLDVTRQPFRIRIVEQTLRENPGLSEVRDGKVSFEDLSRRQQLRRFVIINFEFVPVQSIF
jgi:hypothetical protein